MTIVRTLPADQAPRREERRQPAAPIVKWAGGKTRLLDELVPRLPETWSGYHEPFFGGGALFFRLVPVRARLTDINPELVTVYGCVRDDVEALITDLQRHRYEKDYYYGMRATDPHGLTPLQRASRTIYLNRTCFNGLYRVNRRGQFNVPFGRYKNPVICQEDRLRAASRVLRDVVVAREDYALVLQQAERGDFVYFDPPYQPLTRTANFTGYTAGSFGEEDQRQLAEVFAELDHRGVQVMLSNSDTPLIRELYAPWRVDVVSAPRAISRNGAGRRAVSEVIVRNY